MAKTASILLVDDNGLRRRERAIELVTNGYDVRCAVSFADAERQCRANKPDLVLIGVTHPAGAPTAMGQEFIADPQQVLGFLLNEGQVLCAVKVDGRLLLPREGPGDFVSRVAMLLKGRAAAVGLASFAKSQ